MTEQPFTPGLIAPEPLTSPAYWFLFDGYRLLVHVDKEEKVANVPRVISPAELGVTAVSRHYLGYLNTPEGEIHCFTGELATKTAVPTGMITAGLRRLYPMLPETLFQIAGRAVQIVDWDRTHQYCGRCGHPTDILPNERAKKCPHCGHTSYPRLSPAIIVRVTRQGANGPEILLAHGQRHRTGMYSVLAGFVEPGETLEQCVQREVREETGIEIQNIQYFGSQPWPFPNSLMIAFTAEYASGNLKIDPQELADAQWFPPDNLPLVPPPISIARQLIDDFVRQHTT